MSNEYIVTTAGLGELGLYTPFAEFLRGFARFNLVGVSPAGEVVARWHCPKQKLYPTLLKDAERVERWLRKNAAHPGLRDGFLVSFTPCGSQPEIGVWRCWYSLSRTWIVSTALMTTMILKRS